MPLILHGLGQKDHNYHVLGTEQRWFSSILLVVGCDVGYDANSWQNKRLPRDFPGWIRKKNDLKSYEAVRLQQNSDKEIFKNICAQIELFRLLSFMHNVLATCEQFMHTVLRRFTTLVPFEFPKRKLISCASQ